MGACVCVCVCVWRGGGGGGGGVREQPAPNLDTPVRHTARYLGTEGPGWFCQEPSSNNNPGERVGAHTHTHTHTRTHTLSTVRQFTQLAHRTQPQP